MVHLSGVAPSCSKKIEGTGFVYAPQRVVTVAHVVAGVIPVSPLITTADGEVYEGRVVAFDSDVDVAVLYVPDLPAPPLRITPVPTLSLRIPWGSLGDARVLSYPKGAKNVVAQPIKIEDRIEAEGPDIYKKHQVTRMVLALTADVRVGMSGAPLIVQGGTVAGMVIAAEPNDPNRGYALAAEEILPIANDATKATKHVSTRKCDPGQ
ncbi:trypsin-like peptidase domain-containing protein [Nonomuraea sp. SYSU D8015]|uniref:trypsin-like peptidase domain-containing protein n=1 Tax=Nonomuraea sp. SYSU D8015 TaxID=2593644 RepID=UPI001660A48B|nr:trypsin-like peptidase domain-containing protein [Nonomuraea sp. SYSU D8015]